MSTPRVAVATIIILLGTGMVIGAVRSGDPVAIAGGRFEASGVAHVPGSSQLLFVDDGRGRELFVLELGADGRQVGAATSVALGADVTDLEGITSDGLHFYAVGSQSKKRGATGDGLVRFRYDPAARRVHGVERIAGLKAWLEASVAELRAPGRAREDVLNIEGLAWDPVNGRLLLGLRGPVHDGKALVIPVKLADATGAFAAANLRVDGSVLRLDLGGAGIRGMEYDAGAKAFRIISGASLDAENRDFELHEWDGASGSTSRVVRTFDRLLKPEGVAATTLGGTAASVVVFDVGSYLVIR